MRAFLYSVLMTTAALFTSIVVEGTRQIGREELGPEVGTLEQFTKQHYKIIYPLHILLLIRISVCATGCAGGPILRGLGPSE